MIKGAIQGPYANGRRGVLYRYAYVKAPPLVVEPAKPVNQVFKRMLGIFLVAVSIAGVSLLAIPNIAPFLLKPKPTFQSQTLRAQDNELPEPTIKNFWLSIDKIGLKNATVIREVDMSNEAEYQQAIDVGLAHAKGTAFPGEGKMVYIFGHSTNYPWFVDDVNALFFKLETVEPGDEIFIEYNGKPYTYIVSDKQVIKPSEVDVVRERINDDTLILQTCYPPGTFWQRLLVFAEPRDSESIEVRSEEELRNDINALTESIDSEGAQLQSSKLTELLITK